MRFASPECRDRMLATIAAVWLGAVPARTPAATLQYFQATGQAQLLPGNSPSERIVGYNLQSDYQFFVDSARHSAFPGASSTYFENTLNVIGDNDLALEGTSQAISLGQLFSSTLASADELLRRLTSRIYVPSAGGGEHLIDLEFIDLGGVVSVPSPPPLLPPLVVPPVGRPAPPVPLPVLPPTPPVDPPGAPGELFPATLRYSQATGQAELLPGSSPSGRILGYNLQSNDQFFIDPARASAFPGESAAYFTNNIHEIGDNDFSFEGVSNAIALGQLFPNTLTSADELFSKFAQRSYVPSLGGGEHPINLEFIDLAGAVTIPSPPPVLPPVVLPPVGGPEPPLPPIAGPPIGGPVPPDVPPVFPPEAPGDPPGAPGEFLPATLQYFQSTGQAILHPGQSPTGKVHGYNLLASDQFFVDPTRQSVFPGESSNYFTNNAREVGDNDLTFDGTSDSIPLGQLFSTPLGSVEELVAGFANRIYVPSLGGGEHPIRVEFIDLAGAVWLEPPPAPVAPPVFGSPDPPGLPPAAPPIEAPENPTFVDPPPVVETPVDPGAPPIDETPAYPWLPPIDGGITVFPGIIDAPEIDIINWNDWAWHRITAIDDLTGRLKTVGEFVYVYDDAAELVAWTSPVAIGFDLSPIILDDSINVVLYRVEDSGSADRPTQAAFKSGLSLSAYINAFNGTSRAETVHDNIPEPAAALLAALAAFAAPRRRRR